MPKFTVRYDYSYVESTTVEAASEAEARKKVLEGHGVKRAGGCIDIHDIEEWDVEDGIDETDAENVYRSATMRQSIAEDGRR